MVSAIIPAHNEERTIYKVVKSVIEFVDEVIVIDSCSFDETGNKAKLAGAKVFREGAIGKHYAIKKGIEFANGEELIFLDGDYVKPDPLLIPKFLECLRSSENISLVKGYYKNQDVDTFYEGGRLTELTARPLINLLLTNLAHIRNPLAGEFATRKNNLLNMWFTPGYSVDLGILIHCSKFGEVAQVELNPKVHKHRPLCDLSSAAIEVTATIFESYGIKLPSKTNLIQFCNGEETIKHVDVKSLSPIMSIKPFYNT